MIFREYVKESTKYMNENSEAAELRKHLHDQQMKYAEAAKRKDKSAMDFWNHAIKNTEEEIKYYENENFSSIENTHEKLSKKLKGTDSEYNKLKQDAELLKDKNKTDNDSKIKEYERNIDKYETKLGQLINSGGKPSEIAKIRRVINNYEDLLNKLIQ